MDAFLYGNILNVAYFVISLVLCCLFTRLANTVFIKKQNKIYILTIIGIWCCLLQSAITLVNAILYMVGIQAFSNELQWYLYSIPSSLVWFVTVQTVTWLYIYRIESLGTYYNAEKYIRIIPFFVAIMQIPNLMVAFTSQRNIFDKYKQFTATSTLFTIGITVAELLLFLVLIKKLNFILEFKTEDLSKMAKHLKVSCAIVIVLEIAMAIARFYYPIDFSVGPIFYLLRIYVIIHFYSHLLDSVTDEMQLASYNHKECLSLIEKVGSTSKELIVQDLMEFMHDEKMEYLDMVYSGPSIFELALTYHKHMGIRCSAFTSNIAQVFDSNLKAKEHLNVMINEYPVEYKQQLEHLMYTDDFKVECVSRLSKMANAFKFKRVEFVRALNGKQNAQTKIDKRYAYEDVLDTVVAFASGTYPSHFSHVVEDKEIIVSVMYKPLIAETDALVRQLVTTYDKETQEALHGPIPVESVMRCKAFVSLIL